MMRWLAAVTAGITATIAAAGAALGLRRRRRAARRAERRAAKHRSGSRPRPVASGSAVKPTPPESDGERAASSDAGSSGADASASAAEPVSFRSIKGIGDVAAKRLQAAGISRVDQIAAWSDADLERIAGEISISAERIRREDWVGQARKLSSAG